MKANIAAAFCWGSILGVLFATAPAIHGNAVSSIAIRALVERSDVIAIARIENVAKIGEGTVSVNGSALHADHMEAAARPQLSAKGKRKPIDVQNRIRSSVQPWWIAGIRHSFKPANQTTVLEKGF